MARHDVSSLGAGNRRVRCGASLPRIRRAPIASRRNRMNMTQVRTPRASCHAQCAGTQTRPIQCPGTHTTGRGAGATYTVRGTAYTAGGGA
jgi:hypothetical protein